MKWLLKIGALSLSSRSINAAEPVHIQELRKTVVKKNIIDLFQSLFSVRVRGVFAPANVNANAPCSVLFVPYSLPILREKGKYKKANEREQQNNNL